MVEVWWKSSSPLAKWKICGRFEDINQAQDCIEYLKKNLPWRSKVQFKICGTVENLELLGRLAL